jgi:hypothetical protein
MKKIYRKAIYYTISGIFAPVGIVLGVLSALNDLSDHAFYWLGKKLKIRYRDPD